MDALTAHRSGSRQFDLRVQLIRPEQWQAHTPDPDWDVRALVRHLTYEQLWVPPLMSGLTIAEVGDAFEGDILGDDPKAAWSTAAAAAHAALTEPGALERTVTLSFGEVPASVYVWQLTTDLVVHAWDLARALQSAEEMPNDLLATVLEEAKRTASDWQGSSLFAPPIEVPGCTDDLTELLALTGRPR